MESYIDREKQESMEDEIDSLRQDVPKKDIPKDIDLKL